MKRKKIIRKKDLDFNPLDIEKIEKADIFEGRIEITFKTKEDG